LTQVWNADFAFYFRGSRGEKSKELFQLNPTPVDSTILKFAGIHLTTNNIHNIPSRSKSCFPNAKKNWTGIPNLRNIPHQLRNPLLILIS
jgi:hypothetical protein